MTSIVKQGAQILNPSEYNAIRDQLNREHRLIFDGLIFTGMRAEEFWRFLDHPVWFHPDRQFVELPRGSSLKVKAKQKERMVLLSHVGARAVRDLVDAIKRGDMEGVTRSRAGWSQNLTRAALKAEIENMRGITPKMTRKTWVSWLMQIYPNDGLRIAASMGHDTQTLINHYLGLPFTAQEREQIKPLVAGWGGNG